MRIDSCVDLVVCDDGVETFCMLMDVLTKGCTLVTACQPTGTFIKSSVLARLKAQGLRPPASCRRFRSNQHSCRVVVVCTDAGLCVVWCGV